MSEQLSTSELGKAGEHRVISELLLRGMRPLMAVVDDGIDITLAGGATIQVKTCRTPTVKNQHQHYYVFTMHMSGERSGATRGKKRQRMVADFLILWCVVDNWFYIIPRGAVGQRHTINVPTNEERDSMWDVYKDAWFLLERESD